MKEKLLELVRLRFRTQQEYCDLVGIRPGAIKSRLSTFENKAKFLKEEGKDLGITIEIKDEYGNVIFK